MGGIASLPIPDQMFDEPDNGGYAGGGIVAFAAGNSVQAPGSFGADIERKARGLFPNVGITSRRRSAADNARVGGVAGSYHLTGDARDFTPPSGMSMAQLHSSLKSQFPGYDVINEGDHVHIEPGPGMARPVAGGEGQDTLRGGDTAAPEPSGLMSLLKDYKTKSSEEAEAESKLMEDLKKEASPEYQESERKKNLWAALAQFGFNMASSKSPYVLQAIADAAKATLPEAQASEKERKKAFREAQAGLVELGARNRKEANSYLTDVLIPLATSEQKLNLDRETLELRRQELKETVELRREELRIRGVDAAKADFFTQAAMAKFAELTRTRPNDPPAKLMNEAFDAVLAGRSSTGSSGLTPEQIEALAKARGGAGGGGGADQKVVTLDPIAPQ